MRATRTVNPATCRHNCARLACRLRSAARDASVEISPSYAARLVADGFSLCDQIGVTRLGRGVVIHTAPDSDQQRPVVLGYADADGEWVMHGSHHHAENEER
jgi:hypothetical protein